MKAHTQASVKPLLLDNGLLLAVKPYYADSCFGGRSMTVPVSTDLPRRVAELRFCIEELHRRQQTDRRRAWLWQLKEHAARQALVMLRAAVDDDRSEFSVMEQRQILVSHELLQDPRAVSQTADLPKWRRELQARARRALQQSMEQVQQRCRQTASVIQE